jgi:DNA-directed RNA polymerase subunit alpha
LFTEVGEAMQVESFEAATSDTNRARDIKIDDLDFSVRTYNCLKRQGIETLDELKNYTEDELMNIRNFGSKSYDEVKDKLNEYGFELRPSPSSAAMEELEV